MKREYELSLVIRVDSNEEVMNDVVTEVKGWVEVDESSAVTKIDRWGRRKLAYEIDRQRDGYYVIMQAEIEPTSIDELERNLKLSNSILRYLLIRPD
ncbi:MAG: 30S ribosomal protein S6 [Aggregatilineales bacterium]